MLFIIIFKRINKHFKIPVLISILATIGRCNLHKQKLFEELSF